MSTVKTERPTSELTREARDKHKKYLLPATIQYYQEPLVLTDGKGLRVRDADGNEYLDFFGGILTVSVGHANERVNAAITAQISRLSHVSSLYPTLPVVELAETLARLAPGEMSQCFLATSGTEADETAVMLAQLFTGSSEVVALRHGYSGRSALAQSLTGHASWRPLPTAVAGVKHAPAPYCYRCPLHLTYPSCGVACAEDVRNVIETTTSGDVAAMIAEPIQGVGGFVTPPPEYFSIVKGILDEFDIPFIADEVQTGFGRTGDTYWGIEGYGVEPDAMVMAKGLGNGMAMGAVVGRTELVDSIKANSISTFGGNPLSTTTALANLQNIEDNDLQHNAQRVGKMLKDGLNDIKERHDIVGDVRGKGLMLGIELVRDPETKEPGPDLAGRVLEGAKERGLLIGKGGLYGSVVRMSPPLSITEDDAARAIETIEAAVVDAKV
jgi:4-aminobutyrate aminotransferase-like enzyme